MQKIEHLSGPIELLFTDIDDTLTSEGKLPSESYTALWKLADAGIRVIPVTGRPAGWCEMIARQWPVFGVVGENGALAFALRENQMQRIFAEAKPSPSRLKKIEQEILNQVPGSAVASDQFARMFDLAIDFCEDVPPLAESDVQKIVHIFEKHGATAKVSSIHVNGWFGKHDKLSMTLQMMHELLGLSEGDLKNRSVFVGDSPNDEPMWEFFPKGVSVGDLSRYPQLKSPPTFQTRMKNAAGFVELAEHLLAQTGLTP